ncbi:MAG: Na+/H+ antiporter NhaA [Acidobacteria bacterium]|nr:Na+/H+ antiporter NhaA [Acidobacteriota bacterium]
MAVVQRKLSKSFKRFFDSEKSSGILLIICTAVSLLLANSMFGANYLSIWHAYLGGLSVEHWVNDALMAVFFLFIGLELERELYNGELSNFRNALLPIFAAAGGICLPALIHFLLNAGTPSQAGIGIPMATDIAFALGVLALLGSRVPASLKVFLTALAVMDDLGAIIVIAILLKSGVHATIAGVLLAFAIPFSAKEDDVASPSHKLEHLLHRPVAFIILPIFALANTGIVVGTGWAQNLTSANSSGIIAGLVLGKPIGITLLSFVAVSIGICRLPLDLKWRHVCGAGLLGGIGFTMSIFITNLAFAGNAEMINASKMAILLASLTAGTIGFVWLKLLGQPAASDVDMDTMDFAEGEA